ncbi:alpha/beta fold hydrolase [Nocardioides solisilvae]|uniref:alpha/beta fold hydrolase n=1 Tax=Nocardioides solisilvae TaxID=1542435 RepID=UPI000D743D35|nr:alpha/beta hydrolase [Nocardioides solisilvae]
MHLVLVPGLWLPGASWGRVVPLLEAAGHTVHPVTPPGMGSRRLDRSRIGLRDQVTDLLALVDSLAGPGAAAPEPVVLVGHAEGGALVHAAVDARPRLVRRAVHVSGTPRSDGHRGPDLPVVDGEVPMPEWWELDEPFTRGLDDVTRAAIRAMAVPSPAGVLTEPQRLHDSDRLRVPTTVVACARSSTELRRDLMRARPGSDELALLDDLTWVDLPSSHWPHLTHPAELARVLLEAAAAPAADRREGLAVGRTG